MPIIVDEIPQMVADHPIITLETVVAALPATLPAELPLRTLALGVSGRIKNGKQVGTIVFQLRTDDEIPSEWQVYCNDLIEEATDGVHHAIVMNQWRMKDIKPYWLMNDGRKIITNSLAYTELPPSTEHPFEITWDFVRPRLPLTIPYLDTVWLVGSITRDAFSYNDVDTMAGAAEMQPVLDEQGNPRFYENGNPMLSAVITNPATPERCSQISKYLRQALSLDVFTHVDCGTKFMPEREPIYMYKIYENGVLCIPGA